MKYNLITILFLFFIFQPLSGQITVELSAVIDCGSNPIGILSVGQSTTDGNNPPERAIDGELNGTLSEGKASKTHIENNPYFEVSLENQSVLSELSIHYPSDLFPKGMGSYYILISDYPFENSNLSEKISSPVVESIYVAKPISSGVAIPLNNKSGKFVQIQLDGSGFIAFTEIELFGIDPGTGGSGEICGNGEDDDCDGRIDCEDNDCAPEIARVTIVEPSCPICEDGQIIVNVANKRESDVLYSIDGGSNFVELNRTEEYSPDHLFENLVEGTYNLVVKNDICEAEYPNNPVTLSSPPGIVTSHCPNGGFEDGDFTGWGARWGRVLNEGIRQTEWQGTDFREGRFSLLSAGQDPYTPITYPYLGTYAVRLGNDDRTQINQLTYCFIVDEESADFNFHYAVVLEDPGHDPEEDQPFFQYSISRLIDGVSEPIPNGEFLVRADREDPLFIISDILSPMEEPIVYTNWSCEGFDLTDFIGEEICIEFTVSDCFQGDSDCEGNCIYEWSPSFPLDDSQLEFPTIEGTRSSNAFKEDYNVNIVTPEGCCYQEEVRTLELPPIEIILIEDEEICTYSLQARLTFLFPVHSDLVVLTFYNLTTGEQFDGLLVSEGGSNTSFIFQLPIAIDKNVPDTYSIEASWDVSSFESDDLMIVQENLCDESIIYTVPVDDTYFGNIIFGMPDNLIPSSDIEINRTFGPIFSDMLNHNVYRAKLRIWDRWNPSIVWDKELFSSSDGIPFDMNDLHWDGTNEDGQLHNSDSFRFHLELENCDNSSSVDFQCALCTIEELSNGDCQNCSWPGDFALIR